MRHEGPRHRRSGRGTCARPAPPGVDRVSAPYWAAAARGELLAQRCPKCECHQFYPRALCVRCAGPVAWVEVAGQGDVHTYTVVRQNLAPPFDALGADVVAMIALPEDVRLLSNVTHVEPGDVRIGLPVTAYAVRVRDDPGLPFWRPDDVGGQATKGDGS